MSAWYNFERPGPRIPAKGIKAKTKPSARFGQTWWGGKWIGALERIVDPGRLQRGRSYARSGQVLNVDIKPGEVASRVQGSRPTPYKVKVHLEPLTEAEWEKVCDEMASQAIFAAKLLAGEMPQDIEEAFSAADVALFPASSRDLETECSCPDWANPCKHVAAVYYLLGETFDADPFLLFTLRGCSQEKLMDALRQRRSVDPLSDGESATGPAETDVPSAPPIDWRVDGFWTIGEGLDNVHIIVAAPLVSAEAIKRRGAPPFWSGPTDFNSVMGDAYRKISSAALAEVFGE
jgi:uncharacterized Zn finger protein